MEGVYINMKEAVLDRWRRLDFLQKALCCYIVSLPFMRVPNLPLVGQKLQYSDAFFLILLTTWFIKLIQRKYTITRTFTEFSFVLLLATFSIALMNSIYLFKSFIEIAGIVYLLLMTFLVSQIIKNREQLNIVLECWFITATVVALLGAGSIIFWFLTRKTTIFLVQQPSLSSVLFFPRAHSTFRMGSMLASYIHVSIVFAFVLLLRENRKRKGWIVAAVLLMLVTAFFTASRPFFGIIVSLFLLLHLLKRRRGLSLLRYFTFVFTVLLLIWTVIINLWVLVPVRAQIDRENMSFSLTMHYPHSLYFHLYKAALRMMRQHPFLGVGPGMFNENLLQNVDWNSPDLILAHRYRGLETWQKKSDPHSTYLGWGAETGVFGLAALIFLLSNYFIKFKNMQRLSINRDMYNFSSCCIAGLIGFLINACYIDILTMRHFWFFLAIGVSGYNIYMKR